jgi:hypothetical protein
MNYLLAAAFGAAITAIGFSIYDLFFAPDDLEEMIWIPLDNNF